MFCPNMRCHVMSCHHSRLITSHHTTSRQQASDQSDKRTVHQASRQGGKHALKATDRRQRTELLGGSWSSKPKSRGGGSSMFWVGKSNGHDENDVYQRGIKIARRRQMTFGQKTTRSTASLNAELYFFEMQYLLPSSSDSGSVALTISMSSR